VRESRAAASLRHPNIVTVYDAGEVEGRLYIAMQLVDGTDLATLLRRHGQLESGTALWLLGQIASALDAAHTHGLIHRDVKPGNVMIDDEGAYLTDFGLTKRTTVSDRASTSGGRFLGTIDYAAPEQIAGHELDGRTDLYALGCVLYQCLTGCVPFPRESEIAVLYAHVHDQPPRVTARRPDLPDAIDRVVEGALAKSKDDRPPGCGVFVADAARALETEPQLSQTVPLALDHVSERETTMLPPRAGRPRGRRIGRRALAAAIAATVTALGVLLVATTRDGGGGDGERAESGAPAAKTEPPRTTPDAEAPTSVRSATVGHRPFGISWSRHGLWVANTDDDQVRRLDARTGRPLGDPVAVGDGPFWVVSSAGRLWVANVRSRSVTRIDPATGEILDKAIPVGRGPSGIAAGGGMIWVANEEDDSVTPIRTASPGTPLPAFTVCDRPRGLATSDGVLWVVCRRDASVMRVAMSTRRPIGAPISVGRDPQSIVVAQGRVFVTNTDDDSVTRISARSGRRVGSPIRVGRAPFGIASGDGMIWVANSGSDTVSRLDPRTGRRVGKSIRVGDQPVAVQFGGGAVWVTNNDDGTISRIRP
jgi:serine/threonine-protein kinase